eukprot:1943677-Prymnesium_polylepis.1
MSSCGVSAQRRSWRSRAPWLRSRLATPKSAAGCFQRTGGFFSLASFSMRENQAQMWSPVKSSRSVEPLYAWRTALAMRSRPSFSRTALLLNAASSDA